MINTSDYKWTENCYMKIKDVFPKLAAKLHKRYKFVQRMTYNKIGPY